MGERGGEGPTEGCPMQAASPGGRSSDRAAEATEVVETQQTYSAFTGGSVLSLQLLSGFS